MITNLVEKGVGASINVPPGGCGQSASVFTTRGGGGGGGRRINDAWNINRGQGLMFHTPKTMRRGAGSVVSDRKDFRHARRIRGTGRAFNIRQTIFARRGPRTLAMEKRH